MILYPAIDISDGRAVRLVRGDFGKETVYESDPLAAARAWVQAGARHLHVVDLDGARLGEPASLEHLRRIAELGVPVQYGGGLRSADAVARAVEAGAARVVLGTAAYADVDLLDDCVAAHRDRVVVAVDTRGGRVVTRGWTEATELPAAEVFERFRARGVGRFVYTDVDRDGMLEGPDLEEILRISKAVRGTFVYSGGIGKLEDLAALAGLRCVNLTGVIVGKALYERRFTVAEGRAALEKKRRRRPRRRRREREAH